VAKAKKIVMLLSIFSLISIISFVLGPYSDLDRYMTHLLPFLAILPTIFLTLFVETSLGQKTTSYKKRWILLLLLLLVIGSIQSFNTHTKTRDFFFENYAASGGKEIVRGVAS